MKKQVKYSYCLDENGNLVHVEDLKDETRHAHQWYCLQCGQVMVPNLGKIKAKHFAHKADTACDGESYLHKLAKRLIRDRFLSTGLFPVIFKREVPCREVYKCPLFESNYCNEEKITPFNLKQWYDTCKEEAAEGGFRPDLLLTCSSKPEREAVFIEVFKTHQSNELKLRSEYRIIETKKIETEEDIADIINRGFVEGENCNTYNFKLKLSQPLLRKRTIDRFVLYDDGRARKINVSCDNRHRRIFNNSVAELNMREAWTYDMNTFQIGFAYLLKKGFTFRNCMICNKYRSTYYGDYLCIMYKKLHLESSKPKQSQATNCQYFEVASWLASIPLSELEENVMEEVYTW